jgi:hypothetical protein
MWEKLFLYNEKVEADTVPSLKLISFPFAKDSWRPLCQLNCFAVQNDGLYFRFKPFEAEPKKGESGILSGSALSISLSFPGKEDCLFISADGYGNIECSTKVGRNLSEKIEVSKTIRGGDQQGDYFLISIKIPFSLLDELFSVSSLNEGDKILFNAFYTILENNSGYREHFAALFDKDSEKTPLKKLKNVENLGVLTAVEFY